ncbi:MAG: hypothetical protein M0019_04155 [Actinomycetota bacterium]|nr:hypothetical protein [Actinomycetota bacterium]
MDNSAIRRLSVDLEMMIGAISKLMSQSWSSVDAPIGLEAILELFITVLYEQRLRH